MFLSRINPSTLIGIVASIALLIAIAAVSTQGLGAYINLPGLVIVIGGTLAATCIAYPLRELRKLGRLVATIFRNEQPQQQRDIDDLVRLTQLWTQHDIRRVEATLPDIRNPFLRTGIQLVIDATPPEQIIDVLHWRVHRLRTRERAEAQLFRVMAGFAPAFGMLGTLVGLVNLMGILGSSDLGVIGPQMAIALMTTFYGLLLANLICKPIAVKLERRTEERVEHLEMLLQGIGMLSDKRTPAAIREALQAFVTHYDDEINDNGALAEPTRPKAEPASRPARTPPLR